MLKNTAVAVGGLVCTFMIHMSVVAALATTEEIVNDGVLYLMNDTEAASGVETIVIEETWCSGGPEDESGATGPMEIVYLRRVQE